MVRRLAGASRGLPFDLPLRFKPCDLHNIGDTCDDCVPAEDSGRPGVADQRRTIQRDQPRAPVDKPTLADD